MMILAMINTPVTLVRFALVILINLVNLFSGLIASETDPWTGREKLLQNQAASKELLLKMDDITNTWLEEGILQANRKGGKHHPCSKHRLYHSVYKKMTTFIFAHLEKKLNLDKEFEAYRVDQKRRDAVFKNLTFKESFPFYISAHGLGASININNNIIGSDKVGHFFAQGYTYFKKAYLNKNTHGIQDALDYGHTSEKYYFGLQTTGIYSYGDLASNYDGMRFWKKLIGIRTTTGDNTIDEQPYVICKNGKWQANPQVKFSWGDYVNPAWDEAINCSSLRNPWMDEKVYFEMQEKAKAQGKDGYSCPLSVDACQSIVKEYLQRGQNNVSVLKHLLSPECAKAANYTLADEKHGGEYFTNKKAQLPTWVKKSRSCFGACCSLLQVGELGLENVLASLFHVNHTFKNDLFEIR
ncbi:MAG: hypothetical protein HQK50_07100 [Oligoflexia bacterium]|nr:hypothetical protein [Oligoflexia bacterium]MBF0365321.1 hypothetical protein [Oligoflexia bacterium]